ncbi:hypothetical protein GGI35DRAFT_489370 [Trichoderma velutinum]
MADAEKQPDSSSAKNEVFITNEKTLRDKFEKVKERAKRFMTNDDEAFKSDKEALMVEKEALMVEKKALMVEKEVFKSEKEAFMVEKEAFKPAEEALTLRGEILKSKEEGREKAFKARDEAFKSMEEAFITSIQDVMGRLHLSDEVIQAMMLDIGPRMMLYHLEYSKDICSYLSPFLESLDFGEGDE